MAINFYSPSRIFRTEVEYGSFVEIQFRPKLWRYLRKPPKIKDDTFSILVDETRRTDLTFCIVEEFLRGGLPLNDPTGKTQTKRYLSFCELEVSRLK